MGALQHGCKKARESGVYIDAGKVKESGEILPGITASVQPGHTPGSTYYTLHSGGQNLVCVGDLVHVLRCSCLTPV